MDVEDVMTNRPTRAQRQHGRRFLGLVLLLCVLAAVAVVGLIPRVAEPLLIAGIVVDDNGPVEGATVRIQASGVETRTDIQGRSALETGATSDVVTVSAWKHLYYCAKAEGITPLRRALSFI